MGGKTMNLWRNAFAFLFLVPLIACGSESEERAPEGSRDKGQAAGEPGIGAEAGTGEAACPLPAAKDTPWVGGASNHTQGTCAADCSVAIQAMQLDEGAGCRRMVVLGCVESFGGGTDGRCFRSPDDDRLVQTSSAAGALLEWPECTEADRQRMAVDPCS
jgi:hypothetical protein